MQRVELEYRYPTQTMEGDILELPNECDVRHIGECESKVSLPILYGLNVTDGPRALE